MDNLEERIKASIEDPNGELWFPELTADLAARAWNSLQREIGLTPGTYGTERLLSRNLSTPREIIASLSTCPSTCATALPVSIEVLTPAREAHYQRHDVTFYAPDKILNTTILPCVEDALAMINQVPSLMTTVVTLVRSLHVIKPEDEDHDVSFSEPHVPFSVFVSVPEERIPNDALRVAEAIVHEAMHLQLTLVENAFPLVTKSSQKYYSPWTGTYRSGRGVLHAIYVFRVIDRFLSQLTSSEKLGSNIKRYGNARREEIGRQINGVERFQYCPELNSIGSNFVKTLVRA